MSSTNAAACLVIAGYGDSIAGNAGGESGGIGRGMMRAKNVRVRGSSLHSSERCDQLVLFCHLMQVDICQRRILILSGDTAKECAPL